MVTHPHPVLPATAPPYSHDEVWESCCLRCDRDLVLYLAKLAVTGVAMGFAMFTIANNEDPCKDLSFYTGLLGTVLGSYLEQNSSGMYHRRKDEQARKAGAHGGSMTP